MTGSASTREHETPFPLHIGLSPSGAFFMGMKLAVDRLVGREFRPLGIVARAGLDIAATGSAGLGSGKSSGNVARGCDGVTTRELRFERLGGVSEGVNTRELRLETGREGSEGVSEGTVTSEFRFEVGVRLCDGGPAHECLFDFVLFALTDDLVEVEVDEKVFEFIE